MNKHTPGPWRLILGPKHYPVVQRRNVGGFQVMAEDTSVAIADARLIAAAPCLLDVCQRLLESVPYVSEYDVPLGLWDDLRAAIAKATGGNK